MKKGIIAILLVLVAAGCYTIFFLPTKIALVNFRDSQMAEVAKANDNWFIQPEQIDLKEDDFSGIVNYPVVYLFHISMLTETQKSNLQKIMDNGGKVHVLSATSKENDISNVVGEDLNYIQKCFENEGLDNIKKWLNYSRRVFDGQSLFTEEVVAPKEYPNDAFYRIGTENYYENIDQYWAYYKEAGLYKEGKPTVAMINSSASAQTLFRSYQDSIILNMESRGFNVVALSGFMKRFSNLEALAPDMVMYFPHGRLNMMDGDKTISWLKERNILLLIPQLVYQTYDKWIDDQQGMAGGLFGQNMVVPELDGAIQPFAVAAEYINDQGYHTFQAIPGRIDKFCETAERWLLLKDKPNNEKKLTVFYYKGPGKNALVAGNLEVGLSMHNVLKRLKAEGYDLGDMPEDYDSFIARIYKDGPLLGDYAKGAFEKFLEEADPAMISAEEYDAWCKAELDPENYAAIKAIYGETPGDYFTTTVDGKPYFAIPRVQFGNISLLPVLSAALGENDFKQVHGVKQAPPHAYVASYLWPRMKEKSDIIMHFGTHGSVEFTPWKQVVLSQKDWAETLITPIPHLYIYTIDNIGEAMMAKRRTYATMLSHLTPALDEAGVYDEFEEIARVFKNYSTIPDGQLKEATRDKIRAFADTLNLDKDLGLDKGKIAEMNDDTVEMIGEYVNHMKREKITIGLHTYGVSYSQEELHTTVKMMSVNPIVQSLKALDQLQQEGVDGTNPVAKRDDFDDLALQIVANVLEKGQDPLSQISASDKDLLASLQKEYGLPKGAVISEYYGGSYAKKKKKRVEHKHAKSSGDGEMVYDSKTHKMVPKASLEVKETTEEDIQRIAVYVAAHRNIDEGIEIVKDDKSFTDISSLLDDKVLHKYTNAAKLDASLTKQVKLINNEQFNKLLVFVQDSVKRASFLAWLALEETQARINRYQKTVDGQSLEQAKKLAPSYLELYKSTDEALETRVKKMTKEDIKALQEDLMFFEDHHEFMVEYTFEQSNLIAIQAILKSKEASQKMTAKVAVLEGRRLAIEKHDKQVLEALLQLEEALQSIHEYKEALIDSPKLELEALVNGMNGGYVAPSSGGDPVSNPLAVPTGKNLYSINAEVTPTKEAYELGQKMAEQVLQKHLAKHGEYPKKIAYSLWGSEFIRNQGLNVGQILYMLGVEPIRNQRGRVHDVKLIPMSKLQRPRIDVVVQTSGQFRDIAASRIYLINKAIELATNADDNNEFKNYVKEGTAAAELQMKKNGMSPEEARKFSTIRVFGGVNGKYGTAIMGLVEQGDKWETEQEIAAQYIKNMGAMYAEGNWSQYREGMFETMLQNTEIVVHPRSSNITGPISLDHVYEFMGGITASVRVTTGKDPDGYFNDFRNKYDPQVQGLKEAIWTETRANLFNPKFIKAQMEEGESAAEGFAENFRDTYGWNVMKPAAIDKEIWEGYYDIYVKDKGNLGTIEFFKDKNPYALQEMTAVMLETVRKGYWKPSENVIKDIVNLHATLIKENQAGCSGFVCDNSKLKEMIENLLEGDLKSSYQKEIASVRTGGESGEQAKDSVVLKKEEDKTFKEIFQDNQRAIISLLVAMILIGGGITFGIIRRRKDN